jgi:hypothetical protein
MIENDMPEREILAIALTAQVMFSILGLMAFFSPAHNNQLTIFFTSLVPLTMLTTKLFNIVLDISRKVLGC